MPRQWKLATVIPLRKTDNPQEFSDLRPISILPIFSNVTERLVRDSMFKHVSDLSEVVEFCFIHSYADDTQLYLSHHPDECVEASNKLTSDLHVVDERFGANGLSVNARKTAVITFASRRTNYNASSIDLFINNELLSHKTSVKSLGATFDNFLTF